MGKMEQQKALSERFVALAEDYRREFMKTYFSDDDGSIAMSDWVGDEIGSVLCVSDDLYFDFDDMRYCVDNNVQEEDLMQWYEYRVRVTLIDDDLHTPSLDHWLKGCQRYSEEQLQEIEKGKRKVMALEEEIKIMIKGMKEGNPNKKQF